MPVAIEMIRGFHAGMRRAADADPVFRRWWDEGVKDKLPRAEAWIGREGPAIAVRLTAGL